jgi:type IV pilus assembly protein PilX
MNCVMGGRFSRQKLVADNERGMSLMVVMVALVIMSIGAIGLIRMVDTSALVAGNMAFKQSTTSTADGAAERGISWIQNAADLTVDNANQGYYASSLTELDVTGKSSVVTRALVDWSSDDCAYAASGTFSSCKKASPEIISGDYRTRYVIARMCKTAGSIDASGNSCVKPIQLSSVDPGKGAQDYTTPGVAIKSSLPYYRLIVRSVGPRNTVSLTETYVHFEPL